MNSEKNQILIISILIFFVVFICGLPISVHFIGLGEGFLYPVLAAVGVSIFPSVWYYTFADHARTKKMLRQLEEEEAEQRQAERCKQQEINSKNIIKVNRQESTDKTDYDQLAKIADLHDRGVLTDEEFEKEKQKILNHSKMF